MDGYAGSWANCFWWGGGGLMRYKEWMDMLGVGLNVFGGGGVLMLLTDRGGANDWMPCECE